jgi:hypothetical protein
MRRSTFPMIAVGVLAAQGCADTDDDGARVSRTSGFFMVRRGSDPCSASAPSTCSRFVVSSLNQRTTRCADGSASPACAIATIDLAATGLTPSQADALTASITASLDAPTVVLHGRLTTVEGRAVFVASDAWRAPSSAPVRGAFHLVSTKGSTCAYLPCATVTQERVNASLEPEAITGVDLGALRNVDPRARDLALADAASDDGLLVAGTQSFDTAGRVLRAEQVFTRVRPSVAPGLCAQALRDSLDEASARLVYPSQSDAPFRALTPDAVAAMPAPEDFADAVGMAARSAVRVEPFEVFMQPLTVDALADAPAEQLRAARFRGLERVLREHLSNLTVYRVGTVDVRVYVVGLTACGELAGVETSALER